MRQMGLATDAIPGLANREGRFIKLSMGGSTIKLIASPLSEQSRSPTIAALVATSIQLQAVWTTKA